ncbi:hypothetical protein LRB25_01800, partial [Borreliella burgdorferi]|nr:hypothetical protein [Borreliella burgdorferi]
FSKKLLKFYNEILEKNNQNSCDLQTMKKYLDILEKTKTIVKLSFKNKPTYMIYYKINYPFKGFSSTLQDYYLLISDKLKTTVGTKRSYYHLIVKNISLQIKKI